MAETTKSFPTIPEKQWWLLRLKFRQKIPSTVTPSYLAAALNMKENSAKANILPSLVMCGIVDNKGKPTERAAKWRDDKDYPQVCADIREAIYPAELLEALPPPSPDRDSVERWFAGKLGVGEVASRKMATVYCILSEADPTKQDAAAAVKTKAGGERKSRQASDRKKSDHGASAVMREAEPAHEHTERKPARPHKSTPSIHIDIQIHLDADAPATQIDQVFASMAKHLGNLMNQDEP